jgi:hypothetical protein
LWKQVYRLASKRCEIDLVLHQKSPVAAVVRLLADAVPQRQGHLPVVRGRQPKK